MQMKHLLVALLVLLALVGTAAAADSVEIRSSIIEYAGTPTIPAYAATFPTGAGNYSIDATSWAGLYYDLDEDTKTEIIYLAKEATNKIYVRYETSPLFQAYDFNWGNNSSGNAYGYAVIGFFAEPYVALGTKDVAAPATPVAPAGVKANKIAKLIIDDDTKYTLKTGATLELGEGYSIIADQIDVDGNKVYLKLMKDNQELNSSIVNTNGSTHSTAGSGGDWVFDLTVLGEKNMQVMRVHVKDVFQGTESSLVEIDGLWMVDYLNAIEVKSDTDFGKFENKEASASKLVYQTDDIALSADTSTDLGKGIFIQTEKAYDGAAGTDKFYFYKTYTDAGVYEIRSNVITVTAAGTDTFDYKKFAAFFYDIDENVWSENLTMTYDASYKVADKGIVYAAVPVSIKYDYQNATAPQTWDEYTVMGLFGEKYVPFNIVNTDGSPATTTVKPEKMAKLVIDDDTRYTLKTGAALELGEGYSLIVDQIDVDGNKAYIKFMKDGREINSSIVTTSNNDNANWILRGTVLNEKDVQLLRVHVKSVFQGTQDSLVEIEGLWLMDYVNAREVKTDDKFGILEYSGLEAAGTYITGATGQALVFKSDGDFTLSADLDKQIANNMYLKTADNSTLRYYFYVNVEVGEGSTGPTQPDIPDVPTTPDVPDVPTTPDTPDKPDTPDVPTEPEQSFWQKYMWHIIIAIVLIVIIAGAAYYFLVMKKQ